MLRDMDKHTHDFRGLTDWFEIFRTGTHTASDGATHTWTERDLGEMVANHNAADPAPLVIGHPKTDDPAYGWSDALKVEGGVLFARARQVEPKFEALVKEGRYAKRSVRLQKTGQGWKVEHIGFLGAKPPAIEGLAPVYSAPEGDVLDFESDSYTPSMLARMMRRMRDFLIEKYGAEAADRVMPDYEIDSLTGHAEALRNDNNTEAGNAFARHDNKGERHMDKQFTQADIDAALARGQDQGKQMAQSDFSAQETTLREQLAAERRQRLTAEFAAEIGTCIDAGRLTPAQAEGMAEFMLRLADDAAEQFEFSAGEGDQASQVKKSPLAWFRDFTARLPKQIETGQQSAGTLPAGDAGSLASAAVDYQQSEAKAGRQINIAQAVAHVTAGK